MEVAPNISQRTVIKKNDNPNIKLIVNVDIVIEDATWGYWLEVNVNTVPEGPTGDLLIYQDTIFTDGMDTYEYLPKPTQSKYSYDIAKMIKSMITIWLEKL